MEGALVKELGFVKAMERIEQGDVLDPVNGRINGSVPGRSRDRAAEMLVGVGVESIFPAAISGLTDRSELHEQQKRVGLVHARANILAVTLYTASFAQRASANPGSGKLLSFLGLATVSGSLSRRIVEGHPLLVHRHGEHVRVDDGVVEVRLPHAR